MIRILSATLFAATVALAIPQSTDASPKPSEAEIQRLVAELGSDDFSTRDAATRKLRSLGSEARSALEAARSSKNLETSTRAASLLAELDAAPSRRQPQTDESDTDRRRNRPRQQRLSPFRAPRPGSPSRPSKPPEAPRARDFDDLDSFLKAMQRHIEARSRSPLDISNLLLEQHRRALRGGGATLFTPSHSRTEIVRPDGSRSLEILHGDENLTLRSKPGAPVTLELRSRKDGATRIYEAPSVAGFETEHPEVWARYRETGIFGGSAPARPAPPLPRAPTRPRIVLGVEVVDVPEVLRAHLELPDRALVVERVQQGSAAARLGVKRHDILTHIDGQPMGSASDIRRAMQAAPQVQRATLDLTIRRAGAPRILSMPRAELR